MNKEISAEIYTLYWDNSEYLVESHKKVVEHLGLNVNYHHVNGLRHGDWMNTVLKQTKADIVGFLDPDCVPLNLDIVQYAIEYVSYTKSMIGCAQSSNHIFPYNHIFAAPCFLFIDRERWNSLGQPSFLENNNSDVAENVSRVFEENKVPYKALYPTSFEREPVEGVWRLSNYGYFGIGTVFANSIYHLYQGRYQQNVELFSQRCQDIINGTFNVRNMFSSVDEYQGRICN